MSIPTMTVNCYLSTLRKGQQKDRSTRATMVAELLLRSDPELFERLRGNRYSIAAHWQWPLDALQEIYADLQPKPRLMNVITLSGEGHAA